MGIRLRSKAVLGSVVGLVLALAPMTASADDSSNADAGPGFHQIVAASKGVVVKVPTNGQGQENTSAAAMRVYTGSASVSTATDLTTVWSQGVSADRQPLVTASDVSTDSSTWGWYGGNGWGGYGAYSGYGWQNYGQNYGYYYNYNPCYYYGGNYYNYGYSNSYYPYSSYNSGYNYYYYPSYW